MTINDKDGDEKLLIIVSIVVVELKIECTQCLGYKAMKE